MFGTDEISENLTRRKLKVIMTIVISIFCILILRLGHLQIVKNNYYKKKSAVNRYRLIRLVPPRGVMYDRTAKIPIVDNDTSFDMLILPHKDMQNWNPDIWCLRALERMNLTKEEVLKKLGENRSNTNDPVVIKENINEETIAYIAENSSHIPELIIRAKPSRHYYPIAPHIIGYTAPVTEDDTKNGYDINDVIGKAGLEASYEEYLRGDLSWRVVEVNTFGQVVDELPLTNKAEPGRNLYLSLDVDLQQKAEEIMEGKTGAIVALDPRDGSVMAMVSKPDFSPSIFTDSNTIKERNNLIKRSDKPLLNRAIMGKYPPGSTFKIITATAALEEGLINENTRFFCGGGLRVGNRWFRCHRSRGHGSLSIYQALPQSCNVFFYSIAYKAGLSVPLIHKYALMYGLGNQTGIDLPGEVKGNIPEKGLHAADKVNMAIGQGAILVTPLQMANVMSVIANRGFSYKPHVVKRTKLLQESKPEILVDLREKVSIDTIDIIRNSLKNVAKSSLNKEVKLKGLQTCGKTGTAQNPHGDEHSWFIGFAPFSNPKIVVAVIVENAGRGSEVAAPIAGQIFAQYFYGKTDQKNFQLVKATSNSSNE